MVWVITIWLPVSLALGVLLQALLAATGLPAAAVFSLPFLVFGFQERFRSEKTSYGMLNVELFASGRPYRQVTFWGVPIARERKLARASGTDELSEHVLIIMRAFFPLVLNLLVRRALLPEAQRL
jgi:hypothetical protein